MKFSTISRLFTGSINCKLIYPNTPNDNSVLGIYCFFYQQAVTDKIRIFNNGTFPCVSVDPTIMLIIAARRYPKETEPLCRLDKHSDTTIEEHHHFKVFCYIILVYNGRHFEFVGNFRSRMRFHNISCAVVLILFV